MTKLQTKCIDLIRSEWNLTDDEYKVITDILWDARNRDREVVKCDGSLMTSKYSPTIG